MAITLYETYDPKQPETWVARHLDQQGQATYQRGSSKPLALRLLEIDELWFDVTVSINDRLIGSPTGKSSYRGSRGRWNTVSTYRNHKVTRKLRNLHYADGKIRGEIKAFRRVWTIEMDTTLHNMRVVQ